MSLMTFSQAPGPTKVAEAPLPRKLRELLEDHPEYLLQLEAALAKVESEPASIVTPLERAVRAIEGAAEAINLHSRKKLANAKDSGDEVCVAASEEEIKVVNRLLWKELWAGDRF